MALFPGDVIIKTAIELGLEDLRKNPWLVEDIFSEFIENPLLEQKYGWNEINRAKEFLKNNKINIFMNKRMDKEEFPMVTIHMGDSSEDKTLARLADQTADVQEYTGEQIGKPVPWIIKPFEIEDYDPTTGTVKIPASPKFKILNPGMLLVNIDTGEAVTITGKLSGNKIKIAPDTELEGTKYAIAPRYSGYRARREGITSQEVYTIGCHCIGEESNLLFLYAFVKYSLLRYREGLLENNNFQNSTIAASDFIKNESFSDAQNVYSRYITLTGQCEETWVKTPYRIIEAVELEDCEGMPGIKIISNHPTDPNSEEAENDLWLTIEDTEEES
jgi:hypothetical protein